MLYIQYHLDLLQVILDVSSGDHEAKKLASHDAKCAFSQIQLYLVIVKVVESFFQVDDMVSFFGALDKHVIDIDLHISTDFVLEDLINQPDR